MAVAVWGKPRLGGLTIEETSERKDAVSNAQHKRAAETVRHRRAAPACFKVVLYDSMYEYVRVYTRMCQYDQGLKIFMICTYLFSLLASKLQCAVLRRCISAFINNRK